MSQVRPENVSESPLYRGHRPRSSTVSTAGGDTMRREFRNKLQHANLARQQSQDNSNTNELGQEMEDRSVSAPKQQPDVENPDDVKDDEKTIKPTLLSREVRAELFGEVTPSANDENDAGDGKENIPQNRPSRPKMDIFLKIGSPTRGDGDFLPGDEDEHGDGPSPTPSFRHTILQRVISPGKQDGGADAVVRGRRWKQLRHLWRRAVFRQILLNRSALTSLCLALIFRF